MPRCAICQEKRKKVYQLCKTCTPDASKKTCIKCFSKMCFMCEKLSCLAIHLVCPFCKTGMLQEDLKSAPCLIDSVHYLKRAYELHKERISELIVNRWDLLDSLREQNMENQMNTIMFNQITRRNGTATAVRPTTEGRRTRAARNRDDSDI